jgi:hypothetical protein
MFERNRIDNADQGTLSVIITMADGREVSGKLAISAGRSLYEALNGATQFFDFEPYDGERGFIAKSTIASVKSIKVPRAPNLNQKLRDLDGFDPHAILGVTRDCSWDDIRRAYHARAKAYHPDRYSTAELPEDVANYLAAMARRINTAYAVLEQAESARKQRASLRQAPIFTSTPRV